jgi:hypothetical protein
MQEFVNSLETQLKIQMLEDWYRVSSKSLEEVAGTIIARYNGLQG